MTKLKRRHIKNVIKNERTFLGLSYFAEAKNGLYLLIRKSNLFGIIITILLAPFYILRDGILEYPETVKYTINLSYTETMPKETYDKLMDLSNKRGNKE